MHRACLGKSLRLLELFNTNVDMFKGKKLGEICKHNFKHLYSLQQSSSSGTILMEGSSAVDHWIGEQQAAKYQHGTWDSKMYLPTHGVT